ncbi:MAG: endolytic transglycosylase MltG [Erysipelotrichaceae bacterium]|nr:endolytic transglycosylase MltG [Erysipelotrichaceae bacterium]
MSLAMSKSGKRQLKIGRVLLLLVLVVVIALGAGYSYITSSLDAHPFPEDEVLFEVESGSTLNGVIEKLEREDLIESAFAAKVYAKANELPPLLAGEYILKNGMDVPDILAYLAGNNAIVDQVLVTIPEGTWAKDIAKLIAEQTSVTEEELITLWNNKEFLDTMIDKYFFLTEDIYHKEAHIYLEGFLYPETYYFYRETTPEEVTVRLLDQTNEILLEYQDTFEESEYSLYQMMTLASLVQFEAMTETDMKLVAGLFLKRLDIGMQLQASASVCYALYDKYQTQRDCEYNIDYESKYNTYLVKDFPIGPISNPGKTAIEAVLYPTKSDYLFFVSDSDRVNHYAVTYAEHLKNIDKYLK